MRERVAIIICLVAIIFGGTLSYLFAVRQNPEKGRADMAVTNLSQLAAKATVAPGEEKAKEPQQDGLLPAPAPGALGRNVFEEQRCTTCHSVAGLGNPRYPLDGVSRLSPEELRDWITGSGPAKDLLSSTVLRRKERYKTLPAEEMNALITYLSSFQESKE